MPIRPDLRWHYRTPEWLALSRHIRKERAGDRCECVGECGTYHFAENREREIDIAGEWRCSAVEGQPHPVTGNKKVRLTVAHLDQDPTNNDELNLKALCERCHNRLDMPFRRRNAAKTRRRKKAADDLLNPGVDRP